MLIAEVLEVEVPLHHPPARQSARDKAEDHSPGAKQLLAPRADQRCNDKIDESLEKFHVSVSLRWISAACIPSTATVLRRPLAPPTIVTRAAATLRRPARNRTSSALAAPSTG